MHSDDVIDDLGDPVVRRREARVEGVVAEVLDGEVVRLVVCVGQQEVRVSVGGAGTKNAKIKRWL